MPDRWAAPAVAVWLVLLLAGLLLVRLPPVAAATVIVANVDEFLRAANNVTVTNIQLIGDVIVGDASGLVTLPVRIDNRNLTLSGPVVQDVVAFPYGSQPGVPLLDFSQFWPVLLVGPNSTLTLRDLHVAGIAVNNPAEVARAGYPSAGALHTFPSIVVEDTAQIWIECYTAFKVDPTCTPQYFADQFSGIKGLLGKNIQLQPNNTFIVLGNHTLPLGFTSSTGQGTGQATLHIVGPVSNGCVTRANKQATGGGLSGGAWAGIGVGIAVCVAALAALAAFLVKRRRTRRRPAAASRTELQLRHSSAASKASNSEKALESGALASIQTIERQQLDAGFSGMLRVRFGGLEGLEIGGLIGRGAYGRVYRGSLRGAAVAVKVMEHTIDASGNGTTPGSDPAEEALLLTSLAHPNIVTVYKAATLRVQEGSSSISRGSDTWAASPRKPPAAGTSGEPCAPAPGSTSSNAREHGSGAGPASAPAASNSIPAVNQTALVAAQAAAISASSSGSQGARRHSRSGGSGGGSSGGTAAMAASLLSGGILTDTAAGQFETWLVMEYVDRGSLEDAIRKKVLRRADGGRRQALLYGILVDVAEGMCFLHEANVVHGDLKPGNILLKSGGAKGQLVAKIADFGLSKLLPGDQHTLVRTHTLGTVAYMPPELLVAGRLSRATDVYSFGMIMLEAWLCGPAYNGQSEAAIFYAVVHQQERPSLPDDMPAGYAALIQACWQPQASDRPAFTYVLAQLRLLQAEGKAAADLAQAATGPAAGAPV